MDEYDTFLNGFVKDAQTFHVNNKVLVSQNMLGFFLHIGFISVLDQIIATLTKLILLIEQ